MKARITETQTKFFIDNLADLIMKLSNTFEEGNSKRIQHIIKQDCFNSYLYRGKLEPKRAGENKQDFLINYLAYSIATCYLLEEESQVMKCPDEQQIARIDKTTDKIMEAASRLSFFFSQYHLSKEFIEDFTSITMFCNDFIVAPVYADDTSTLDMLGDLYFIIALTLKMWIYGFCEDAVMVNLLNSAIDFVAKSDPNNYPDCVMIAHPFQLAAIDFFSDFICHMTVDLPKSYLFYSQEEEKRFYSAIDKINNKLGNFSDEEIQYMNELIFTDYWNDVMSGDDHLLKVKKFMISGLDKDIEQAKDDRIAESKILCVISTASKSITNYVHMNMTRFATAVSLMNLNLQDHIDMDNKLKNKDDRINKLKSQYEEKLQKEKAKNKKITKELTDTKQQLTQGSKSKREDKDKLLNNKIKKLNEQIKSLENDNKAYKNRIESKEYKKSKSENHIATLESRIDELQKKLADAELKISSYEDMMTDRNINDDANDDNESIETELYCPENIEIAKKTKFAFFVPEFVNINALKEKFPNSSFYTANESNTFILGSSVDYVVICTKGIKHAMFYRIKSQCEQASLQYICVDSYGVKTMFKAAIDISCTD